MEHLHCFCDQLFFLTGGNQDGKMDLIITAEGNEEYFFLVESLVREAPSLENWNIIAFKQPTGKSIIGYKDIELNSEEIYFDPLENKASSQIGLRLYVNNYDSDSKSDFLNAAYWMLDSILGEKSVALDIGYVDVADLSSVPDPEVFIKLSRLPNYIEWKGKRDA